MAGIRIDKKLEMKVVELKPSDRYHRNKRNGMFDNLIFNNVAENSRTFHRLQSRMKKLRRLQRNLNLTPKADPYGLDSVLI